MILSSASSPRIVASAIPRRPAHALLLLTIVASLHACSEQGAKVTPVGDGGFPFGDSAELSHAELPSIALTSTVLADPERLTQPGRLAVIGNHIAVVEGSSPRELHIFNRTTGQQTARLVSQRDPISRTRAFWSLDVSPRDSQVLFTFDLTATRLSRFTIDRRSGEVTALVDSFIAPRTSELLTEMRALGDGSFLGRGFLTSGSVVHLDSAGNVLAQRGDEPPGASTVPVRVRAHAYQGAMSHDPDRTRFAVAYRHAGAIDVIDRQGRVLQKLQVPYAFAPRYGVALRGAQLSMVLNRAQERLGYTDVATTACCVYALFSGRLMAKHSRTAELGRFVHVFSWDGTLSRILQLDAAVQGIAVDRSDSVLYGTRRDPYPAVLRFALPTQPTSPVAQRR